MLSRKPKVIYSILIAISVKVVKKKKINRVPGVGYGSQF